MLSYPLSILKQQEFNARMLRNQEDTGVAIKFSPPSFMELRGLQPSLPPNLRLLENGIQVSFDGEEWSRPEDTAWLNVFRLLDPRIYADRVLEREIHEEPGGGFLVIGVYKILDLGVPLPDGFFRWLEVHSTMEREIRCRLDSEHRLKEMAQGDLPPFGFEQIIVRLIR